MSHISKEDIILIALQDGEGYSPVQVQKLLFLIDSEKVISNKKYFNFQPYNYGPFDKEIYNLLESLYIEDKVNVQCDNSLKYRKYSLTTKGKKCAKELSNSIDKSSNNYIKQLAEFVRNLSFTELVSAIYQAYPEMKVNSVFKN